MRQVLVIGSGFAGLWAALAAARRLDDLGASSSVQVTVLSAQPFHDIRVRNYEADLRDCRIPLSAVLDPVGVRHLTTTVTDVDIAARTVTTTGATIDYDRLVVATGSHVVKPGIPGLAEFGFDVDTYDAAMRLDAHLSALAARPPSAARDTVVVVGAGLTGVETACELPRRLAARLGTSADPRVVLVDRNPQVGSDMGPQARPEIEAALTQCGVQVRTAASVAAVDPGSVTLSTGEVIAAATVIWCAGMRAADLGTRLGVPCDRLGRLPVDDFLRVAGVRDVFAAGDAAAARMDDEHLSVMSCQHGRPMGRYAGYNVISDLLGEPMLPLRIPWYVTVLDLGPAGAVYTEGWDRRVVATGAIAKNTKTTINTARIYPPLQGGATALLAAAAPDLQAPPGYGAPVSGS